MLGSDDRHSKQLKYSRSFPEHFHAEHLLVLRELTKALHRRSEVCIGVQRLLLSVNVNVNVRMPFLQPAWPPAALSALVGE